MNNSGTICRMAVIIVHKFNSVNRDGMWQLLRQYGIPSKIVNIINEEFSVQVINEASLNDSFKVNTGMKQGCLLSLTLFLSIVYSDRLDYKEGIRQAKRNTVENGQKIRRPIIRCRPCPTVPPNRRHQRKDQQTK